MLLNRVALMVYVFVVSSSAITTTSITFTPYDRLTVTAEPDVAAFPSIVILDSMSARVAVISILV